MTKPFTHLLALLGLTVGAAFSAQAQTTYSQVPLTAASFTADIVANGAAASPPTASTTADVDGAGYYLISQDYYTATTAHTSGVPNTGLIPNNITGLSGLTYQLASLSANNSLRLSPAGSTGTVTFATPRTAAELYVLGISGSGASTVTMTVNYSDGTTTAFASQTYPDWFAVSATQNVFGTTGRASLTVPVSTPYTASNTAPFLDQVRLTIPTAKIATTITGITFTTATGSGVLNILAVSAAVPAPSCAAAPTNLATVASTTAAGGTPITSACSSTSIYLSVSGVPNNSGYTYQWQSSTTSATAGFADISGATSATYTATGQTAATYYRVLVGCQFATGSTPTASTATQVTQSPLTACYCTPTYANGGANDAITRVRVGTLDNATTGNAPPYYRDYTSQQTGTGATLPVPVLPKGLSTTLTLDFGSDGTQYSGVWVDFNQNGTFDAATEFFAGTRATSNGTTTITLVVPATAPTGNTRMRVRGGDDSALTSDKACGASNSSYGEAEDYLVNVSVVTATSRAQAPTALTLAPNPTADGHVLLELTGFRETATLTVVNSLGQRVYAGSVTGNAAKQQQVLDLHHLPAGVYVLHARTANGLTQSLRFVRE